MKNVSISVNGVYKRYLIKHDTFEGTIKVNGYDFTSDGSTVSLVFDDGYTVLCYSSYKNGMPILKALGTLSCTPNFKKVLICVNEPVDSDSKGWSGKNGIYISAPSTNRSDSLEIAKLLSGKSKWLSQTNWH